MTCAPGDDGGAITQSLEKALKAEPAMLSEKEIKKLNKEWKNSTKQIRKPKKKPNRPRRKPSSCRSFVGSIRYAPPTGQTSCPTAARRYAVLDFEKGGEGHALQRFLLRRPDSPYPGRGPRRRGLSDGRAPGARRPADGTSPPSVDRPRGDRLPASALVIAHYTADDPASSRLSCAGAVSTAPSCTTCRL